MLNKDSNLTFEFISSSDGAVPRDGALRRKIRKQAMSRAAASRKETGIWGKNNIRQYPVYVHNDKQKLVETFGSSVTNNDNAAADAGIEPDKENRVGLLASAVYVPLQNQFIPPLMPSSGYEGIRNQLDYDILQMPALSAFHIGCITGLTIANQRAPLADALRYRQWLYVPFLPSRYGHYACLDDAIRCVAVRVREWISALVKPSLAATSLYARALKSLQVAINDPNQRMQPEILCASQVLSVYELLDASRKEGAWSKHVAGASALIKLRGPDRVKSPFERALFLAHVEPIFNHALMANESSFLEEAPWHAVHNYNGVPKADLVSDNDELISSSDKILLPILSLFRDVQDVIRKSVRPELPGPTVLLARALNIRQGVVSWRKKHKDVCENVFVSIETCHPRFPLLSLSNDFSKRFEPIGTCSIHFILLDRLITALKPSVGFSLCLEAEACAMATEVLRKDSEMEQTNIGTSPCVALKTAIAQATLDTEEAWRAEVSCEKGAVIADVVFTKWIKLLGRAL